MLLFVKLALQTGARANTLINIKKKDIDQWLLSNESKEHKEIPDMAIELLQYKLAYKALFRFYQ